MKVAFVRKKPILIAGMIFVLLVAAAALDHFAYGPARRAEGIYLAEGGLGYVVLRREGRGLRQTEPTWLPENARSQPYLSPVTIEMRRPGFRMRSDVKPREGIAGSSDPTVLKGRGWILDLVPSAGVSGDFDLEGFREPDYLYDDKEPAAPPPPVSKANCASYLHRIDDQLVPQYFAAQFADEDPARALGLAVELLKAYPSDLHVRALYLEALLKAKDFGQMQSRIGEWRAELTASENHYLRRIPALADYMIRSNLITESGQNAYKMLSDLTEPPETGSFGTRSNLNKWLAGVTRILEMPDFMYPPSELNPARLILKNLLHVQVFSKVARQAATFLMIQGDREQALRLLEAALAVGERRCRHGYLVDRLIGIAILQIELSGLSLYALNACESVDELDVVARVLDRLKDLPDTSRDEGYSLLLSPFPSLWGESNSLDEELRRYRTAVARSRLLRAAVAAKRSLLVNGVFPRAEGDFDAHMDGGLPLDPFDGTSLQFAERGDALILHSVGIDLVDNRAATEYDPTNGVAGNSHSVGDVIQKVPRQRQYPFPGDGTKAASADDLRRQYPNGLPVDTFATTRNRPLGISAGPPLRIYSFGPDNDESTADQRGGLGDGYEAEVMYDPTNGITSSGDLFIEIPAP